MHRPSLAAPLLPFLGRFGKRAFPWETQFADGAGRGVGPGCAVTSRSGAGRADEWELPCENEFGLCLDSDYFLSNSVQSFSCAVSLFCWISSLSVLCLGQRAGFLGAGFVFVSMKDFHDISEPTEEWICYWSVLDWIPKSSWWKLMQKDICASWALCKLNFATGARILDLCFLWMFLLLSFHEIDLVHR